MTGPGRRSDSTPAGSGARGAIDVERLVVWAVVLVAVMAIVGTYLTVGAEWRKDTPDADFAFSYDAASKTVTVSHAGGDPIRDTGTKRLELVFVDADRNSTVTVTWVADNPAPVTDRGVGYPVESGDSLAVDDPELDSNGDGNFHDADATVGFHLATDDRVRVVWTGSLHDAEIETVVLAERTVTNATGS